MFIQQMRLEYPDHAEEIAALSFILSEIQAGGTQPHMKVAAEYILKRLDELQLNRYVVKAYP